MLHHVHLSGIRREQGRLAEVVDEATRFGPELLAVPVMRARATLHASLVGARTQAEAELRQLTREVQHKAPRDSTWPTVLVLLAEAAHRLDDRRSAVVPYAGLLPFDGRLIVSPTRSDFSGPAEHFLGLLSSTLGRVDEAEQWLRTSIAVSDRIAAAPRAAWSRLALARVLHDGDAAHGDEVSSLLSSAAATARDCGMGLLATEIGLALDLGPTARRPCGDARRRS